MQGQPFIVLDIQLFCLSDSVYFSFYFFYFIFSNVIAIKIKSNYKCTVLVVTQHGVNKVVTKVIFLGTQNSGSGSIN